MKVISLSLSHPRCIYINLYLFMYLYTCVYILPLSSRRRKKEKNEGTAQREDVRTPERRRKKKVVVLLLCTFLPVLSMLCVFRLLFVSNLDLFYFYMAFSYHHDKIFKDPFLQKKKKKGGGMQRVFFTCFFKLTVCSLACSSHRKW